MRFWLVYITLSLALVATACTGGASGTNPTGPSPDSNGGNPVSQEINLGVIIGSAELVNPGNTTGTQVLNKVVSDTLGFTGKGGKVNGKVHYTPGPDAGRVQAWFTDSSPHFGTCRTYYVGHVQDCPFVLGYSDANETRQDFTFSVERDELSEPLYIGITSIGTMPVDVRGSTVTVELRK